MEARFISASSSRHLSLVGLEIIVRADAGDTGGAVTALEQIVPSRIGSPLHTVREDKVLTVLEGQLNVQLGSERQRLGPGATAVIPGGTPHRFYNSETHSARLLMLILPGGHETYLTELAQLEARGELTPGNHRELGHRYGVEILPDPSG